MAELGHNWQAHFFRELSLMELTVAETRRNGLKWVAKAGHIAKGIVYVLLGILALMAAFESGGRSAEKADKSGVFDLLKASFAGNWILPVLGFGLACYSAWRMVQVYHSVRDGGKKKWKGLRYFFSGLLYFSLAVSAFRYGLQSRSGGDNTQQQLASELLSKPFGQWMVGIAAVIIACTGFYQLYYGLSEKYRKHVQKMNLHNEAGRLLLSSGKLGYTARGVVWLIIAFLFMRAAMHSSSAEAGGTGKAMQLLGNSEFGTYLLGALGAGLMMYGMFNFIRARYEDFNQEIS